MAKKIDIFEIQRRIKEAHGDVVQIDASTYKDTHKKARFEWQPKVFDMPDGKTYRPDFYLTEDDRWIEIKGRFRIIDKQKWDWFQSIMPNSELWNKEVLKNKGIL